MQTNGLLNFLPIPNNNNNNILMIINGSTPWRGKCSSIRVGSEPHCQAGACGDESPDAVVMQRKAVALHYTAMPSSIHHHTVILYQINKWRND